MVLFREEYGSGVGTVLAGIGITLFISNEDIDFITRIIQSLENSDVLVDGVSETVKHKIQN